MNEKFPWFRNLVADNIYLDILHSNIDHLNIELKPISSGE